MGKTILNFIQDIEDGLVSQENFNEGISNLYGQLAATSLHADEPRALFIVKEQETRHASLSLRGALLFRSFVKATFLRRGIVEAAFHYDTSAGQHDQLRVTNPLLLSGLRGLAFLVQNDVPGPYYETFDKVFESRIVAMGDLALGAYFSARSGKRLEPLGNLPASTLQGQTYTSYSTTNDANTETQVKEDNYNKRSIGDIIETVCGVRTTSEELGGNSGASRRAIANWIFLLSGDNFERLGPHLSNDETTTARILLEWWDGSIDFTASSAKSRIALFEAALSGTYASGLPDDIGYQNMMRSLFFLEFLPHAYGGAVQNIRPIFRGKCAWVAAAQRLAISIYESLFAQHSLRLGALDSLPLKGNGMLRTVTRRGSALGASISSCGWLQNEEVEGGFPYYLWDIQQRHNIVSSSLSGRVEYTAISHTWGRWKKNDCPSVHVNGVNEWSIPQNTKFDVTDLPDILASAGLKTRFVWFDLLCIPQEADSEHLKAIARDEIARQAKIFRIATHAVAWINDVKGWEGLRVAVRQHALHYLRTDIDLPAWMADLAYRDSEVDFELFQSPDGFDGEVNGWFSSLWTLQELCLRPDMTLVDRHWNVFAIEGQEGTGVRVDDLIALSGRAKMQRNKYLGFPDAPFSRIDGQCRPAIALDSLFENSGLANLPNASRTTILMLGNRRHCRENRAEAIMSAVGVTDWYKLPGNQEPTSQNGGYPLLFLREAARKIGPEFYASRFNMLEINTLLMHGLWPSPNQSLGTLMPFGTKSVGRALSINGGATGSAHPSVKTWTIQPDYSVDISQAGIISYTGQSRPQDYDIMAEIDAPHLESHAMLNVKQKPTVNLDHWVNHFYPQTRNFAVCLHYGRPTDGVLLKEAVTGDLVKIGNFCIIGYGHIYVHKPPETYMVNWHVL